MIINKDITMKKMNFEITKDIFAENIQYLKDGHCYNNVFYTLSSLRKRKKSSIVYGFVVSGIPFETGVAVRHCWSCIDGKIADTTMFVDGYFNNDFSYISFVEYNNFDEYLEAIINNNNYPCLTFKDEDKFIDKIQKIGYKYIG